MFLGTHKTLIHQVPNINSFEKGKEVNVYSFCIFINFTLERIKIPFNREMDKYDQVHPDNGPLPHMTTSINLKNKLNETN